jgi:hypothetical protein
MLGGSEDDKEWDKTIDRAGLSSKAAKKRCLKLTQKKIIQELKELLKEK